MTLCNIFLFKLILLLCVCLLAYLHVYHNHAWYQQRLEEGIVTPGTEVTDDCKPPYGYWEAKLGLLQEQQELLITELSLLLWIHVILHPISSHNFKIYI